MKRREIVNGGRSKTLLLLAAGVYVFLGAAAHASEDAEPSASPSTTPAPSATPKPTPKPTPASTPSPEAKADDGKPGPTPWPWPFPWMEEAERDPESRDAGKATTDGASPTEPASDPTAAPALEETADAAIPGNARDGSARLSESRAARDNGGNPGSGESPDSAAQSTAADDAGGETPSGSSVPLGPLPATSNAAALPPTQTNQQHCEPRSVENGVEGDEGSIVQVAVQSENCSWEGAQVLIGYDIRGPPVVDVLVQSTGMSIDIEAHVTRTGTNMTFGYIGGGGDYVVASPTVWVPFPSAAGEMPAAQSHDTAGRAQAQQTGDNRIGVGQEVDTTTGDALSGSQRVLVSVDGDAQAVRLLAQNSTSGTFATSGDAVSFNETHAQAGPVASGAAGAGSSQIGNNRIDVEQASSSRTGDAVAGSQDLQVRVNGSAGEVAILAQNDAAGSVARSGDAVAVNAAAAHAGPSADAAQGSAQSSQIGNNRVGVDQKASAVSGDATAGSQVIDIRVAGSVGRLGVLAQNDASGSVAQSGDAVALNLAEVSAGPSATTGDGQASASQTGNNRVEVDQFAEAATGTAVAGAQTIRIQIGGGVGQAAVLPQNSSDGALAVSGNAVAANDLSGAAGPTATTAGTGPAAAQQHGSNDADVSQATDVESGDSVAGGQVTALLLGVAGLDIPNPSGSAAPAARLAV